MKKTILMISLILICLLLGGAGYRFYLSQYEEECLNYSWIKINRTAEECGIFTTYINITTDGRMDFVCDEEDKLNITREVITTDKCIKYRLVRNIKIDG